MCLKSCLKICKKNEAIIIEDAAHALYSDFVDHNCGHFGDYVLYSLHKMLPMRSGGMLKVKSHNHSITSDIKYERIDLDDLLIYNPFNLFNPFYPILKFGLGKDLIPMEIKEEFNDVYSIIYEFPNLSFYNFICPFCKENDKKKIIQFL